MRSNGAAGHRRPRSITSLRSDALKLILEGLDLVFSHRQRAFMLSIPCPAVPMLTLGIILDFYALQLEPAPVDNLVCEDGEEGVLDHRSTSVFVEVALLFVSIAGPAQ